MWDYSVKMVRTCNTRIRGVIFGAGHLRFKIPRICVMEMVIKTHELSNSSNFEGFLLCDPPNPALFNF